jgi:1-acyl-sn-glycerol-3-phosphate acyltransferase
MFGETIKDGWRRFARLLCRIFCEGFFRMRYTGLENIPAQGAFVLASNHQSYLDPMLCGIGIKPVLCFMARDTLFNSIIFGPLLRSVDAIPVKRGQADISSIRAIIEKLKKGKGVCLFPESTRTTDGKIAPFKGGFTLLCRRGNAPLIPVLLDGAFECWPRDRKLFKPWSEIFVCYGKAIASEEISTMDDEKFAAFLTERLRTMQSEIRLRHGKQPFNY